MCKNLSKTIQVMINIHALLFVALRLMYILDKSLMHMLQLLHVFTGILCGRCRHDHQGVGVLTMLCQNCDGDNVIFLPIVLLG